MSVNNGFFVIETCQKSHVVQLRPNSVFQLSSTCPGTIDSGLLSGLLSVYWQAMCLAH